MDDEKLQEARLQAFAMLRYIDAQWAKARKPYIETLCQIEALRVKPVFISASEIDPEVLKGFVQ